ncbi:DnaJ domain-containing protein [Nemania sp. NC0429]|nr:DnaJ domain-containing protein [Nemania sp. NC0429]
MAPAQITEDLYMILEVDQTATVEVIIRSYKRLALKHHPDRNAGRDTTAAFQQLGKAYETLKDESKRQAYDLLYPSIKRSHTAPPTSSRPPPTSTSTPAAAPQPGPSSEALEIAKLEKAKQERRARWWTQKTAFESSISKLQGEIKSLEEAIKGLADAAAAETAEEAWKKSWSAWVLSPIYKQAQLSEEEKANKERKTQERRIETDMKERRLYTKKADLEKQKTLLKDGQAAVDNADRANDFSIRSLQAKIRLREAKEWEEREKQQRKAAEERARQQRERAAAKKRQEEQQQQSARSRNIFEEEGGFSAAGACVHDGWWPKIQGRTKCPECYDTWNYLLECPGCKMKACPKCQSTIRPRRRNPPHRH